MNTEDNLLVNNQANPVADPHAIIIEDKARFTILTSRLIRLEWIENGIFQDYSSFVFINRLLPVPHYNIEDRDGWLEIHTEHLFLRYKKGSGCFTPANLQINFELNGVKKFWHPGMEDTGNLRGTTRTLDRIKGAMNLEAGVISKDGWTLINDSDRPLFDHEQDWHWVIPRPDNDHQDYYFFGHGHDYKAALKDFTSVAGKIPIPPKYAFGYWWSRYWAYTDEDFRNLIEEFNTNDVPLDVLIIDMDWHLNFKEDWLKNKLDQAGEKKGWTGFTWNKIFFPDPEKFIRWLKSKGLHVSMNLHPASGVQPHEEQYPAMAKAMGKDPNKGEYIPFDIVDRKFTENYFKILLHPFEDWGVDFWWLDWQQWGTTKLKGVTPTFWLNYVHYSDMERRRKNRPIVFHRWGGLGNHRYPVGFSGDTYIDWKSLSFQPYFTSTASNVAFGYWSHDIGGHYKGISTPELYARWIQFGIFSPIFRTHASNNPRIERRIWGYPTDYFYVMRDAIQLRYALVPYIYTMAREAYDTGVSICRPMYYDYPEADEAYIRRDQYMFGNDLIVSPITKHIEEDNLTVPQTTWIPEGEWIEWFSGSVITGPVMVTREYTLEEIPLFVKQGAIIPMQNKVKRLADAVADHLILSIYPGESGSVKVYEDENSTNNYIQDSFSFLPIDFKRDEQGNYTISIHPIEGTYENMPQEKFYEIRLINTFLPHEVFLNGELIEYKSKTYLENNNENFYYFDGNEIATIIKLCKHNVNNLIEIVVHFESHLSLSLLDGAKGKLNWVKKVRKEMNSKYNEYQEWVPDILTEVCQISSRISNRPDMASKEFENLSFKMQMIMDKVEEMADDNPIFEISLNLLKKLEIQFLKK